MTVAYDRARNVDMIPGRAKYCAESTEGSCQLVALSLPLASSVSNTEWIAMIDDRNNWIVGCLKHAHFNRTIP